VKKTFTYLLLILLVACSNDIKFDKTKWMNEGDLQEFPYRKAMLKDLVTNYKLKGLSYKQMIDLIGEPQKNLSADSDKVCYPVLTDYGRDIDPVHTIILSIQLGRDSTVSDFRIDEWEK